MADSYAEPKSRAETVVAIQYLRAVAAGLIVFQHAMGIPAFVHYTAHFGTVGVDLFFVISGFIMWTTTERRERGPVQFWLARIVRIVPLYWIFTVIYVAAALGVKRLGASSRAMTGAALGTLLGLFLGLPGLILGPFVGAGPGAIGAAIVLAAAAAWFGRGAVPRRIYAACLIWIASATAELTPSAMTSTPLLSIQLRTMPTATSGLFW